MARTDMHLSVNTKPLENLLRVFGKHMAQAADELGMLRLTEFEDDGLVKDFRDRMAERSQRQRSAD